MAAETKAWALYEGTVTGLAADAKNGMELLSIQTPVLQMSSYNLAITVPGIFLLIYVCFYSSSLLSSKSIINKIFLRI